MNPNCSTRRQLIHAAGATALVGSLAGCAGDADADIDGDIAVGAGSGGLEFEPEEIEIETGTTLVWEWTGQGGGHNVKHQEDEPAFESEIVTEAGHTFEHTFEEPGTYEYECTPHVTQGMVGTVEVVDE